MHFIAQIIKDMYEIGLRILKTFDCIKKCMTTACLVLKHKFIVYIR